MTSESEAAERRLLLKIWYPATVEQSNGFERETLWSEMNNPHYFSPLERLFTSYLKSMTTSSYKDAPIATADGDRQVIIYNHALLSTASENTLLMEALASHGYIVISVQHEDQRSEYAVLQKNTAPEELIKEAASLKKLGTATHLSRAERSALALQVYTANITLTEIVKHRAADSKHVLDHLVQILAAIPRETKAISFDQNKVAFVGLSLGGAVATELCKMDQRCSAVVNLDGGIFGTNIHVPTGRPYLMLYSERNNGGNDFLKNASGNTFEDHMIVGADHMNFHDASFVLPGLKWIGLLGNIEGAKIKIAILFGGLSAEHEVSILSGTNVMKALSPERYAVTPIYITRTGRWLLSSYETGVLSLPADGADLCFPHGGQGRLIALNGTGKHIEMGQIDILFPVLHGLPGEDGAVQGLAETAGVPLAGCGIAGSANALDKDLAKRLLSAAGVETARSLTVHKGRAQSFSEIREHLGLPVFVKPARQGSSVGVSKVETEEDYEAALAEGFRHDRKLLAEEFIQGREIECAVLEEPDDQLFVSRTGEIVPAEKHGFYTYDAKYIDGDGAALIVPANLPQSTENSIRETAALAFEALGCDGMARVDFFLCPDGRLLVNELNTIPGFTDISMYSKVMAASGVSYAEVIDRLVAHGLARAERKH
eukprot:g1598.t1